MSIVIRSAITVPEGDNITVKRLMPVAGRHNFDPFVLWDHFDIAGGGFPNHPHRGFEAITYMFAGGMQHTDNLGNSGTIRNGGAQRFTAGKGIVHSEMPEGQSAGIQLWINLPKRLKQVDPEYQQVDSVPVVSSDGTHIRTIVGEQGAIQLKTDVEYLDIALDAGAELKRAIPEGFRGFVYLVDGSVRLQERELSAGSAAFIEDVAELTITADNAARLMWCFGSPHHEPIHQHGPFVD